MTSTTEALKMAIESLELITNKIEKWTDGGKWLLGEQTLNLCKKALESQEQENEASSLREPVAWMNPANKAVISKYRKEQSIKGHRYPKFTKPLYTHPAQPLSDDEILKIANGHLDCVDEEYIKRFARAIEAAHGIGVKDE